MTSRTFRLHAALHDVIGLSQIIDRCERDKQRTLRDATSRAGFAYQKYTIISGQVQPVLPGAAESIRAQRLCRPDDNRLSCNRNADQPIQERCRVYVPRTLEALILDAARHFFPLCWRPAHARWARRRSCDISLRNGAPISLWTIRSFWILPEPSGAVYAAVSAPSPDRRNPVCPRSAAIPQNGSGSRR